ncbi:hypothetical protein CASFOL_000485 [Castilleja foliolosa]|uniref:SWIM-type domain-containing protein n=1 Tax=Castilleja foliolosa TaxID=1961234 RepID=A0ABD3EST7_9LAMI
MLRRTIPGSFTAVAIDRVTSQFQNAFFALEPAIQGFRQHARLVIVLDGTFLTGKYKGILFVAVTHDGNNQIFPLAARIGHVENEETWTWFLGQLERAYGSPNPLLIVSDGAKSISNAIKTVFPRAKHGLCVVHMMRNMKVYGREVVNLFRQAAFAFDGNVCSTLTRKLQKIHPGAYENIMKIGLKKWARSACDVRRFHYMTSNAAETFNAKIIWARTLPVTSVLEILRSISEKWFYKRNKAAMERDHELTEVAQKLLGEAIEKGAKLRAEPIGSNKFNVKDELDNHLVDMSLKECSCGEFHIMAFPCGHAAAAARMFTLREMWGGVVLPLPNPSTWDVPEAVSLIKCIPPDNPKQAGRPRTNRRTAGPEGASSSRRKKQVYVNGVVQPNTIVLHAKFTWIC